MKNLFELVKAQQWDINGIVWKNDKYQAEVEIDDYIYLIFYKEENGNKKQLGSRFNTSLASSVDEYPKWVHEVKQAIVKQSANILAFKAPLSREQSIPFDAIYDLAAAEAKKHAHLEHFNTIIWDCGNGKERFVLFHNGRTYRGGMGSSWMYLEYQRFVDVPRGAEVVVRQKENKSSNRHRVFSTKVAFAEGYIGNHESRIMQKNRKFTTQFQSVVNKYKAIVRGDDRRAYALDWYYGRSFSSPMPTAEEFINFFYSENNMSMKQFIPPAWEYPKTKSTRLLF